MLHYWIRDPASQHVGIYWTCTLCSSVESGSRIGGLHIPPPAGMKINIFRDDGQHLLNLTCDEVVAYRVSDS